MLFFGHVGLTIGITKVCQDLLTSRRNDLRVSPPGDQPAANINRQDTFLNNLQEKLKFIDYRCVLLGSLLPDIIDKPLWLFTNNTLNWDGRGYSHTCLFSFALLVVGLVLAIRWKKSWLLTVSIASFFHLIFDLMWLNPTALWWPLLGPIPREQIPEYLSFLWRAFLSDPFTYISESLGLLITLFIAFRIIWKKQVTYLLKTGLIDTIFR
jgi:inner membrane protein